MNKYESLWEYIKATQKSPLILTFNDIKNISGVPIDHSFLKYKKDLISYGYQVEKISMKNQTVTFIKRK